MKPQADGPLWHANKDLLRDHVSRFLPSISSYALRILIMLQTAKSRSTDYAITEIHVSNLIQILSDGGPHDCMDQLDRYMLDVVSDVFLGECADTLSTESQPLRHAVEEMYVWNTTRVLIGYLSMSCLRTRTKALR